MRVMPRFVEAGAAAYRAAAWQVIPEATFNHFGERGSVDLLAGHAPSRSVAVNEMKSEIGSVEETGRRHDVKVRRAMGLAEERFGWKQRFIGRILVVPEDRTVRRIVERHAAVFDAMYPARSREVAKWLAAPTQSIGGIWFLSRKPETHAAGVAARSAPGCRARGPVACPRRMRLAIG